MIVGSQNVESYIHTKFKFVNVVHLNIICRSAFRRILYDDV